MNAKLCTQRYSLAREILFWNSQIMRAKADLSADPKDHHAFSRLVEARQKEVAANRSFKLHLTEHRCGSLTDARAGGVNLPRRTKPEGKSSSK
jgi:hypothetical protein